MKITVHKIKKSIIIINIDDIIRIGLIRPTRNILFKAEPEEKIPFALENVKLWLLTKSLAFYNPTELKLINHKSTLVCRPTNLFKFRSKHIVDTSYLDWNQRRSFILQNYYVQIEALPDQPGSTNSYNFLKFKHNAYKVALRRGYDKQEILLSDTNLFKATVLTQTTDYSISKQTMQKSTNCMEI